jgi:hypothetical protein
VILTPQRRTLAGGGGLLSESKPRAWQTGRGTFLGAWLASIRLSLPCVLRSTVFISYATVQ